jgi:hypothetical protein
MRTLLIAALLTGCATAPPATHELSGVSMAWVRTSTTAPRVEATGVNACTVYAPEPAELNDTERMAIFGAAALHCFNGESAALPTTRSGGGQLPHTRNRDTMYVEWTRTLPAMPDGGLCPQPSTGGLFVIIGGQTKACTFQTGADSCHVYAPMPTYDRAVARLGHEVLHCFLGEYHH